MTQPQMNPTATMRVRRFLDDHDVYLAPWSGLEETFASLYCLLTDQRSTPMFWSDLETLIRNLTRDAQSSAPDEGQVPFAELLSSEEIADIATEMRRALPTGFTTPTPAVLDRFCENMRAPVLGAFMGLGLLASGCHQVGPTSMQEDTSDEAQSSEGEYDTNTATPTDSTEPVAEDTGYTPLCIDDDDDGHCAGVVPGRDDGDCDDLNPDVHSQAPEIPNNDIDDDCDGITDCAGFQDEIDDQCGLDKTSTLYKTLAEGCLNRNRSDAKTQLCQCFDKLRDDWAGELTRIFETQDAQTIAAALDGIADCCDWSPTLISKAPPEDLLQALLNKEICEEPIPVYLAVRFPDSK